jgi:hypothetical protein
MDNLLTLLAVAGCSYIMGVPGADDVMLAYQSSSFHDALYLRRVLGLRPAPEFEAWLERILTRASGFVPAVADAPIRETRACAAQLAASSSQETCPTLRLPDFQSAAINGSARLHAGFRRALNRSGRSKARLELFALIATPGSARRRLRSRAILNPVERFPENLWWRPFVTAVE